MSKKVRLVVSDVDGTLVTPGSKAPGEGLYRAIRELHRRGISFAVNSGRQFTMVEPLFKEVLDIMYSVCQNGSVVYCGGRKIWENAIGNEAACDMANKLDTCPDTEVMISTSEGYFITKGGARHELMREICSIQGVTAVKNAAEVPGNILQVTLFDLENVKSRLPFVEKVVAGRADFSIASAYCIDINAGNKGTGVTELCRELDISPDEVMCFGDSYNDVPMLRMCGHPYIMEGADDELLAEFGNKCDYPITVINRELLS